MWEQNVLFRSKMLKLFFSALPHICIRAREDTKNREYTTVGILSEQWKGEIRLLFFPVDYGFCPVKFEPFSGV